MRWAHSEEVAIDSNGLPGLKRLGRLVCGLAIGSREHGNNIELHNPPGQAESSDHKEDLNYELRTSAALIAVAARI